MCTDPCDTCSSVSPTDCLTCNEDFYIDGTECKPCDISCNKCTSLTHCTECNDGYYLDIADCKPCSW
jgi:hypothetical protein